MLNCLEFCFFYRLVFGVFAKKVIQNRTVFGPYEGEECETWDYGREDRLKLRVKYTDRNM